MSPRRSRSLTLALLFLVFWGLTTHGKYSNTGDEPHYLMIAQSLRADRDLDLGNNYALGQGALFGAPGLQHELHALPARDGTLRPAHDIGVPVALLPAYIVATTIASKMPADMLRRFRMNQGLFAYALTSLAVMTVVLLAASVTITALRQSGMTAQASAATVFVAWATVPILANAYEVFPEPFALLATALTVREWTSPASSWSRRTWWLVATLGLLPWFHRKFIVYVLALLGVTIWHKRESFVRLPAAARVGTVVLFMLPVAALLAWTYHYWGNVGGPLTLARAPFSFETFVHGAPGLLVDRENGLFWWAPAFMLAPAAFSLERARLVWLLPIASLVIPAASHDQWWAGFSPACRFLVPLVPILCLVGVDLLRCRTGRLIVFAALVPQIVIAAYGWQHPHELWPRGDAHNRLLSAVADGFADAWLPSFRVPSPSTWPLAVSNLAAISLVNAVVAVRCRRSFTAPS